MLTGSVVSSLQGEPRSSHDIDIVISLNYSSFKNLQDAFPSPRYYVSPDAMRDAVLNGTMFNVLSIEDGEKVDMWVLTKSDFDRSRFSRRIEVEAFGVKFPISTPEDTILAKLHWCQLSNGSRRQYHDALKVYETQYPKLDLDYLNAWVAKLNLQGLWESIKKDCSLNNV